jgi:hypothetical protein
VLKEGKRVLASYQFKISVSVRGTQWQMHRRTVREHSAIFRTYDELFPKQPDGTRKPDRRQSPYLFSVFLDPEKSTKRSGSVSFAFDLAVLVPDYEVDGLLFLDRHYEGGYIYRELILVEAILTSARSAAGVSSMATRARARMLRTRKPRRKNSQGKRAFSSISR